VKVFNAFARESVLIAKRHCSADHKAALKKRFKLFDASSPKYARAFLARRRNPAKESEVFEGITEEAITKAVPEDMRSVVTAMAAGMTLAASLLDDDTSELIVSRVAASIISKDPSAVEDTIIDEDLIKVLHAASSAQLPERLLADLQAAAAYSARPEAPSATPGQSLGIIGLAEEISRELDISSLMMSSDSPQGQAGLASIIESINRKVQGRIQDGSVDADRLCTEAQSILGKMPSPA
jgi:hypothetical protein